MDQIKFPLYAKVTTILLGLWLTAMAVYFASAVIFPLLFSVIFAILLNPVYQFLERLRFPRIFSIALTVALGFFALVGVLYFIYAELSLFSADLPRFKAGLMRTSQELQTWLTHKYGFDGQSQINWFNEEIGSGGAWIGQTVSTVTSFLIVATLIPVYIFLLMLYRPLLMQFFMKVFSRQDDPSHVREVMLESKAIIQSYIVGRLIEGAIVAVMYSVALLLIGVDYAILLGVLGALLNFIPYIGSILATILPVLMAMVTKNGLSYSAIIIVSYIIIQLIDSNFLIPRIVASKVKVNALVAMVGVLAGNALGGIPGTFLAIPCIAILKIIFDRIEPLKPWGMLLGDDWTDEGGKTVSSGETLTELRPKSRKTARKEVI